MGDLKITAEIIPLVGADIDVELVQKDIHALAKKHPGVVINTWVMQDKVIPDQVPEKR